MNAVLRVPAVMEATGYARPTVYARVKAGLLPPPIKIGVRASAWPADEIAAINKARISGYSDDGIRELVAILTNRRTESV